MIGPILATLIAIAPAQMPNPAQPQVQEQVTCVDWHEFVSEVKLQNDVFVFEILLDYRIGNISAILRKLTNALDAFATDPDLYVVLTIPEEPVAMLIPVNHGCVMRPLYINLEYYQKIRGEK